MSWEKLIRCLADRTGPQIRRTEIFELFTGVLALFLSLYTVPTTIMHHFQEGQNLVQNGSGDSQW